MRLTLISIGVAFAGLIIYYIVLGVSYGVSFMITTARMRAQEHHNKKG